MRLAVQPAQYVHFTVAYISIQFDVQIDIQIDVQFDVQFIYSIDAMEAGIAKVSIKLIGPNLVSYLLNNTYNRVVWLGVDLRTDTKKAHVWTMC